MTGEPTPPEPTEQTTEPTLSREDVEGLDAAGIAAKLGEYTESGGNIDDLDFIPSEDGEDTQAGLDQGGEEPPPAEAADSTEDPPPQSEPPPPDTPEDTPPGQEATPPEPGVSDEDLDADLARYPKPEGFDPRDLKTDEGKAAHAYYRQVLRVQGMRNKRALEERDGAFGERSADDVREVLSRYDRLNSEPEFEAARNLLSRRSRYADFCEALLDESHPSHQEAAARVSVNRAPEHTPADAPIHREPDDLLDEDGLAVDPAKLRSHERDIARRAIEAYHARYAQEQPQEPAPDHWGSWADSNGVPRTQKEEYLKRHLARGNPTFTRLEDYHAHLAGIKADIERDSAQDWETARVADLQTSVEGAQPRPRRSGPGRKTDFDLEAPRDLVEVYRAVKDGKVDLKDPEVRRRAGLD